MHTEHLQNVRPSRVFFGWFVSVALISLFALALAGFGLVDPETGEGGGLWAVIAIAVGFFLGGWFTGVRAGAAPILHGVAMGLVSVLVWFAANLLFGEPLDAASWGADSEAFYAGSLLLQFAAAITGASIGSRSRRLAPPGDS